MRRAAALTVATSFAALAAALASCVGDDPSSSASRPGDGGGPPTDAARDGSSVDDASPDGDAAAPSCVPPPAGLTAWWTADGVYGDVTSAHSLTPVPLIDGGAISFVTGKVVQAFDFEDAFLLGPSTNLTFTGITAEGWVLSHDNLGSIFGGNDQGLIGWRLDYADVNTLRWNVKGNIATAAPPPIDAWAHLAATWDGTTLKIYVNGTEVGSEATDAATPDPSVDRLRLGASTGADPAFRGHIDEAAVYGRALGVDEIQAIVEAGPAGKCKQ
jgi:hypothetical protein